MKIVVIQDYLRSGGTERQSILLANAFAAAGHSVTLLTFRPGGALRSTVSAQVLQETVQPFDTGLDWFAPGLKSQISNLKSDIVLAMGRMANCYAGGIQRHLDLSKDGAAVISTMRTGKPLPDLFRASLHKVRHVVANSDEARDRLVAAYGVEAARISVIRNALVFNPAPESSAGRDTLRASMGASPGTSVLLCVAMFRPEKNQAELIEIAAGLPRDFDWQLWLAGDGPERANCDKLARERELESRVRFPGWQADPSAYYAAADLAVHASWSESLSNFLIEAQAGGLPGVAYSALGIAECFAPDATGEVITRDDRDAFRAAVLKFCRAPAAERRNRSEQARAHAHASFDSSRQIEACLELFRTLQPSGRAA